MMTTKKSRKKKKRPERKQEKTKKTCPAHYQIQTEAISAVIYKNAGRLEELDMHTYLFQ